MPFPQMQPQYVKGSETSRVSTSMVSTRKPVCMVQCGLFLESASNFKKPLNTYLGCLPPITQNNLSSLQPALSAQFTC